jgi:hypothetical protein
MSNRWDVMYGRNAKRDDSLSESGDFILAEDPHSDRVGSQEQFDIRQQN